MEIIESVRNVSEMKYLAKPNCNRRRTCCMSGNEIGLNYHRIPIYCDFIRKSCLASFNNKHSTSKRRCRDSDSSGSAIRSSRSVNRTRASVCCGNSGPCSLTSALLVLVVLFCSSVPTVQAAKNAFSPITVEPLTQQRVYTNRFAVQLQDESLADQIATKHNYVNHGQIGSLKGHYLFEHQHVHKRSLEYSHIHHNTLKKEPTVLWVEQQHVKRRVKRDGKSDDDLTRESRSLPKFSDPLYSEQWYLHKGAYGGNDMNVGPVWEQGITGKGVVVTILDDGIQTNHPDLVKNYDPVASIDINGQDDDPMPQDNGNNKHGTRCAGEVAATAFNEFCGIGIAYNASIGGVRMLDGSVTDEVEARALSLNPHHIDIYSASWGPEDDGKTVDGPGRLAKRAFIDGISFGRKGLGSIFVWASGNGGRHQDNCNCDGYTNSIYTLSISSATQAGAKPWYLEECSSTLATTYSSGTPRQDDNIVTVDMDNSYFRDLQNNRTPNPASLCTKSHTGTSASAPIAAAICALALEANPRLGWRDMQHLVVLTSRPDPLNREDGWVTNGVGKKVNHKFGYGLMDAGAMVKLAKEWTTVPPQRACHTPPDKQERIIPSQYGDKVEVTMVTDGCRGSSDGVQFLEHVQVVVSLQFQPRGNLHLVLVSPAGTASSVLFPRPYDAVESSINNWPFLSVHFWGENPQGQWKLLVVNEGRHRTIVAGKLKEWSLVFFGTETNPYAGGPRDRNNGNQDSRSRHYSSFVRETTHAGDNLCVSQGKFQKLDETECLSECPESYYGDNHHICQQCSPLCGACYGPGHDHCLYCTGQMFLSKEDNCVEQCPSGQYGDVQSHDCLPCASTCAKCSNAADNCEVCQPGFFLYQEKCVGSCVSKTYSTQDGRCNDCHPSCLSCKGPRDLDCLTCAAGTFLFNGTCKDQCPEGNYDDFAKHACFRCGAGCSSCEGAGKCKNCVEGWSVNNGFCYPLEQNCQTGLYMDDELSECAACHPTCKSCSAGSKSDCIGCPQGRLFYRSQCLSSCPSSTFADVSEGVCLDCPSLCSQCDHYDQCNACHDGAVLQDRQCTTSCSEGWYFSGGENHRCLPCHSSCESCTGPKDTQCTLCKYGSFLLSGNCRKACPEGFHTVSNGRNYQCLACHHLCASCSGPGPKACLSCPKNSMLVNKVCYTCLLNEFYDTHEQRCLPCHPSCSQCTGNSDRDCQACPSPLRLQPEAGTCLPCCPPDQPDDPAEDQCCSCAQDSELCGGFSDKTRSVSGSQHPPQIPLRTLAGQDLADDGSLRIPMKSVLPMVVGICVSAVVLFFVVFGVLQASSYGFCRRNRLLGGIGGSGGGLGGGLGGGANYKRIPVAMRYDGNSEKVALTGGDQDDEDEEDEDEEDLFEKT